MRRCCTTCSGRSTATPAEVYGFEFGLQHFFESGFGLRANYAYTDTKAFIDGEEVAARASGVSAYSAAVMFENDRWDAQLAVDYSGRYIKGDGRGGRAFAVRRPDHLGHRLGRLPVDGSVGGYLEGSTDEFYRNHARPDMLAGFETWGRSVLVGVTAKF